MRNEIMNIKKNITKKNLYILLSIFAALLILIGVYLVGYKMGIKDQQAINDKKTAQPSGLDFLVINKNRWSIVGTVEKVSSDSITVKNNKGLVQTATIPESAEITDNSAKDTTVSSIKKGSEVIVVGTKDDNNEYSASTIRIK